MGRPATGLDETARRRLGAAIAQARDERGWTLLQVADRARCDEGTVRNAVAARPVQRRNLLAIARALGLDFAEAAGVAPDPGSQRRYGYGRRDDVRHYEGLYQLVFINLLDGRNLFASALRVVWDETERALTAEEFTRVRQDGATPFGGQMRGALHINEDIGFAQFLLNAEGMLELITASRLERGGTTMFGAMLSQVTDLIQYRPVVSPVVIEKAADQTDFEALKRRSRLIGPDDPDYARLEPTLRRLGGQISPLGVAAR